MRNGINIIAKTRQRHKMSLTGFDVGGMKYYTKNLL
jgi:hypothetical protein